MVAVILNYGEPQMLEVFKNTLPSYLYWVLFPIYNLRQAMETAKKILTKENLGRLLTEEDTGAPPYFTMKKENEG